MEDNFNAKETIALLERRTKMMHHIGRIKGKCKKLGIPFNITIEDVELPSHCPVLGIPLDWDVYKGGPRAYSPSIDKIFPEKGYVKGNVCVISSHANRLKNNATIWELERILSYMQFYRDLQGLEPDDYLSIRQYEEIDPDYVYNITKRSWEIENAVY